MTLEQIGRRAKALEVLEEIGREIASQDNLATADPIWIVQEKERLYGIDEARCDPDGREQDDDGNEVAYVERWIFGGPASLTRRGIEEYISIDGHNRRDPRAYAVSLRRCQEMICLRRALMDLADTAKGRSMNDRPIYEVRRGACDPRSAAFRGETFSVGIGEAGTRKAAIYRVGGSTHQPQDVDRLAGRLVAWLNGVDIKPLSPWRGARVKLTAAGKKAGWFNL